MNHGERHSGCRYHELPHLTAQRRHLRNWLRGYLAGVIALYVVLAALQLWLD